MRLSYPRTRLVAALALVCASFVVMMGWMVWQDRQSAVQAARNESSNLSGALARQTTRTLDAIALSVELAAKSIETRHDRFAPSAAMHRLLAARLTDQSPVATLIVANEHGDIVQDSKQWPPREFNISGRDYFQHHRAIDDASVHIGAPLSNAVHHPKPFIPVSIRLNHPDGRFAGVLVAGVQVAAFEHMYSDIALGKGASIMLMRSDATLFLRQPHLDHAVGTRYPSHAVFAQPLHTAPKGTLRAVSPIDGVVRLVSYQKLDRYPFVVTVGLEEDSVLAPWWRRTQHNVVIGLGLLAVIVGLGLLLTREVRRRMRSQQQALAGEQRYRLLAESTSDVILCMDLAGRLTYVSPRCMDLFGYLPAEVLGQRGDTLIHPEDAARWRERLASSIREQTAVELSVVRVRHKAGHYVWVEASRRGLTDPHTGALVGLVSSVRDITARNEAEQELERQYRLLRTIVDNIPDGVAVITEQLQFALTNEHLWRVLDIDRSAVLSAAQPVIEFIRQRSMHDAYRALGFEEVLQRTKQWMQDGTQMLRTREQIAAGKWIEMVAMPMPGIGFLALYRDISPDVQHQQELAAAKQAAEAANEAKGQFLAMMSHEIRTPLTGILGLSELVLEAEQLPPKARRQLELLHSAATQLRTLLNELLDFSRIEAGKLTLESVNFTPAEVVQQAARLFAHAASSKDTVLAVETGELPDCASGDPARLRQVLLNLIGNAVKFTDCGRVLVRAWEDARAATLHFEVSDTGPGIAPQELARVFEPFTQVDASSTRRYEGTGLGLAICKRLVEAMGGQIGVRSELGAGSTFFFHVRMAQPLMVDDDALAHKPTAQVPERRVPSVRILLAEDNVINRMLFTEMLEHMEHVVDAVSNGAEAVAAVREQDYDLVLMDLRMPVMDGVAATRAIRAMPAPKSSVPVIAISAEAARLAGLPEQEGFDDCLAKPVNWQAVQAAIARLAARGFVHHSAGAVERNTATVD